LITITWLVVVLGVIGVFVFDVVSVVSSRVSAENDAQNAAYAASSEWHTTPNVEDAYQAAVKSLTDSPAERIVPSSFSIAPDGTVHLVVRRRIQTMLLGHIGPLRHLTIAVESGDANSIN
jgi:hypothetical protein